MTSGISRAERGFTLVELLVVVAIIAVLLALLFPALSAARAKAQAAGCTSHLGQLSVAVNAWASDHNGNFIGVGDSGWFPDGIGGVGGYGMPSQAWYNMLGRYGYIGSLIMIRRRHVAEGWYPGIVEHWKYPLLRDPGEPQWTTMDPSVTDPNGPYKGVPYTMWEHSYLANSYAINGFVRGSLWCSCDRGATTGLADPGYKYCSGTLCGGFITNADQNLCCVTGYQTVRSGVLPAKGLVLMDHAMINWLTWNDEGFYGENVGFDYWSTTSIHVTDPRLLHAFRHPGGRANGMFHDGHVESFQPMEYVAPQQRVLLDIWSNNWQ